MWIVAEAWCSIFCKGTSSESQRVVSVVFFRGPFTQMSLDVLEHLPLLKLLHGEGAEKGISNIQNSHHRQVTYKSAELKMLLF